MNRVEARQPSALFNWGWYRHQLCGIGKKNGVDVSSAPICTQALDDLKAVAENSKISILYISPASMSVLGEMYRGCAIHTTRPDTALHHVQGLNLPTGRSLGPPA